MIIDPYLPSVCVCVCVCLCSICSSGAGIWSICSRRALTASDSSFRATSKPAAEDRRTWTSTVGQKKRLVHNISLVTIHCCCFYFYVQRRVCLSCMFFVDNFMDFSCPFLVTLNSWFKINQLTTFTDLLMDVNTHTRKHMSWVTFVTLWIGLSFLFSTQFHLGIHYRANHHYPAQSVVQPSGTWHFPYQLRDPSGYRVAPWHSYLVTCSMQGNPWYGSCIHHIFSSMFLNIVTERRGHEKLAQNVNFVWFQVFFLICQNIYIMVVSCNFVLLCKIIKLSILASYFSTFNQGGVNDKWHM